MQETGLVAVPSFKDLDKLEYAADLASTTFIFVADLAWRRAARKPGYGSTFSWLGNQLLAFLNGSFRPLHLLSYAATSSAAEDAEKTE